MKYLTIREFAVREKITPRSVARWVDKGLPCIHLGKKKLIPEDAFDRMLENQNV
jgi:hypothetical protein